MVFLTVNRSKFFMAGTFETTGTLHAIFDEVQVTEKFRKREFVLEISNGMYTDFVKFQLVQDKCSALNSFRQGEVIKVSFNLSGRKATMKDGSTAYFTNLSAWKIEHTDGVPASGGSNSSGAPQRNAGTYATSVPDAPPPDDDDIPF